MTGKISISQTAVGAGKGMETRTSHGTVTQIRISPGRAVPVRGPVRLPVRDDTGIISLHLTDL